MISSYISQEMHILQLICSFKYYSNINHFFFFSIFLSSTFFFFPFSFFHYLLSMNYNSGGNSPSATTSKHLSVHLRVKTSNNVGSMNIRVSSTNCWMDMWTLPSPNFKPDSRFLATACLILMPPKPPATRRKRKSAN